MTNQTLTLDFGGRKEIPGLQSSSDAGGTIYVIVQGQVIAVPADQAWFWTPEWQAGEHEVDQYIIDGNVETFDTMEDFLRTLRE